MRIGLDIHGVIDRYPALFAKLSKEWVNRGWQINIITGQEWQNVQLPQDLRYTYHYSIVDHHRKLGTHLYERSDKEGWWMENDLWVRSKGNYAASVELDVHFDDYAGYAKYFPTTCTYVVVGEGFENFYYNFLRSSIK